MTMTPVFQSPPSAAAAFCTSYCRAQSALAAALRESCDGRAAPIQRAIEQAASPHLITTLNDVRRIGAAPPIGAPPPHLRAPFWMPSRGR